MTFSGGLIDMTLFGILQGNEKTNWIWIVAVGLFYAVIYYFVFSFMIRKFDLKTPGREAGDAEVKLYTRKDMNTEKNTAVTSGSQTSMLIVQGLGGRDNISDVDCCATRLRITVADSSKVNESLLRESGASGVICKGNGVQVVYGPQVSVIRSELEDYLASPESAAPPEIHAENTQEETETPSEEKRNSFILGAHLSGRIVPLSQVDDDAFSGGLLGDGAAIEPTEGKLYSPADGIVETLFDTCHAISIAADNGCQILLHIGIDTVKLNGRHFTAHVSEKQKVKKGDLLISFDIDAIRNSGYQTVTPLIICNSGDYSSISLESSGIISAGSNNFLLVR